MGWLPVAPTSRAPKQHPAPLHWAAHEPPDVASPPLPDAPDPAEPLDPVDDPEGRGSTMTFPQAEPQSSAIEPNKRKERIHTSENAATPSRCRAKARSAEKACARWKLWATP